jgi:hypothetical protein
MKLAVRFATIAGGIIGSLSPHWADAQIIDQYFPHGVPGYNTGLGVTVQSRARDEYVSPGVKMGDVVLEPSLNESVGYNSNITGLPNGPEGLQINTTLTLQAGTDWSRNGLFGYLNVDELTFPTLPTQNQMSWVAALGGTHDFGRDQLQIAFSHFNLQQTAADLGSLNFRIPETFHVDEVRASYKSDFGRISVLPGLQVTDYTFDQGTTAGVPSSLQSLDRIFVQGNLAFRYEISPQRNAVLVFSGYNSRYTNSQLAEPSRDNSGVSVRVGFEYTASGVFRYRGEVGFEQREYSSPLYAGQGTPVGDGELIWTPTELTTITLSAARAIENAANATTVGFTYTTAKLVVDHEYKRNILLQGYADVQSAAYEQNGGSQIITNAGANISWLLNRNMRLKASYDFTKSDASSGGTAFVGNAYRRSICLLEASFSL